MHIWCEMPHALIPLIISFVFAACSITPLTQMPTANIAHDGYEHVTGVVIRHNTPDTSSTLLNKENGPTGQSLIQYTVNGRNYQTRTKADLPIGSAIGMDYMPDQPWNAQPCDRCSNKIELLTTMLAYLAIASIALEAYRPWRNHCANASSDNDGQSKSIPEMGQETLEQTKERLRTNALPIDRTTLIRIANATATLAMLTVAAWLASSNQVWTNAIARAILPLWMTSVYLAMRDALVRMPSFVRRRRTRQMTDPDEPDWMAWKDTPWYRDPAEPDEPIRPHVRRNRAKTLELAGNRTSDYVRIDPTMFMTTNGPDVDERRHPTGRTRPRVRSRDNRRTHRHHAR